MTRREVRTPIAAADVVDLGNRVWRKQVLPHTTINYQGRPITFDKPYCDDIAAAFRAGAYPGVPFQFADADNRHTNDPSRTRGEVIGMESTDDGLFATLRLSEEADQLVREYPNFGVSVRVKEDYERPDGKAYPRAMQHLLGTWDPKLVDGLAPWQAVDMAHDDPGGEVIDLTQYDDTEEQDMTTTEPGPDLADLIARGVISVNDPDALSDAGIDWTGDDEIDTHMDTQPGSGDDDVHDEEPAPAWPLDGDGFPDIEAMSDDEFAAWSQDLAAVDGADWEHTAGGPNGEYVDVDDPDDYGHVPGERAEDPNAVLAASQAYSDALDLAHSGYDAVTDERLVELSGQNAALQARLDAADYQNERDTLVRRYGIPPYLLDLAQPLLEGDGRDVVLSNGDTADAGQVMRGFLDGLGKAMDRLGINMLDLSQSTGQVLAGDGEFDAADHAERRAKAARIAANIA